ncbi:thiosulfate:glutathione sulfurtransferase [Elgaria multicarinata webbii]|uniref:thiosulfate:glutathione sulfurtransferase n=1 Tax=Elgaria multicarinata webbii TaxID=159646 RepID=UPI002FCCD2D5
MKALRKFLGGHPGAPPGFVVLGKGAGSCEGGLKAISYEDMKQLVTGGRAWIFDVRSPGEVANGRIANAVHIPVAEVEQAFRMDPEAFKMKYGVAKPQTGEENLVFYCQLGLRGARATEKAISLGYAKARNYAGGYKEWSEKGGK